MFSKICHLIHVPNIILGAVDDDGNYAGDDADYNYDGDAIVITIKIMNVE